MMKLQQLCSFVHKSINKSVIKTLIFITLFCCTLIIGILHLEEKTNQKRINSLSEPSTLTHQMNEQGSLFPATWLADKDLALGSTKETSQQETAKNWNFFYLQALVLFAAVLVAFLGIYFFRSRIAMKKQKELFQSIFDETPIGIAHLDLNGNWIRINKQFSNILGFSDIQLKSTPYTQVLSHTESIKNQPEISSLLKGEQQSLKYEKCIHHLDKTNTWIEVSANLKRTAQGTPLYVVIWIRDIHQQKQSLEELIRSQQYVMQAEQVAGIGYWIIEYPNQNLVWSNQANSIFDFYTDRQPATLETLLCLVLPEDRPSLETAINNALEKDLEADIEFRIIKGAQFRRVHSHIRVTRNLEGQPLTLLGTAQDVTSNDLSKTRLRQAARVFDNASEGIVIADPTPKILLVNRAFCKITGYSEEEVVGKNPKILSSGRHDLHFYQRLWKTLKKDGRWQGEIWNRRKNGEIYPEWLTIAAVCDEEGELTHYISTFSDISKLKESEDKLAFLAHHDSLTRLPNRILLDNHLRLSLQQSAKTGRQIAVLFLDLDQFKFVNDSYGHPFGDRVLQLVAQRLLKCIDRNTLLTRHGGDEFVLVTNNIVSKEQLEKTAQSLLKTLEQPFSSEGKEIYLRGSLGISLYPEHGHDADTLIKNADVAMFEAKNQGRNRYTFYHEKMTNQLLSELELVSDLHQALKREELEVYYQPQISLTSGKISGVEALLRWNHGKKGMIAPDQFIPIAERSGLIIPIGNWVLNQACAQLKKWQHKYNVEFPISVNLSALQFVAKDLVVTIEKILAAHQLNAHTLELELTEGVLIEDPESTLIQLNQLTNMGSLIALDDFGTGYSSLSYLSRFPINRVKIDKSFVSKLIVDTENTLITRSIVSMSHHLGCQVVAEGVETLSQMTYLLENGCDHFQGYLFSKPLCSDDLSKLLHEKKQQNLSVTDNNIDSRHCLLLVDDEPAVLSALKRVLRKQPYRILTVENPYEAFELFAVHRIGVVITDQRMPQMTGTEFLIRVRRLYPETVRIVLSGHADIAAITAAINEGDIYRYLLKPWEDQELIGHITEAFDLYERKDENSLINKTLKLILDDERIENQLLDHCNISLLDDLRQEIHATYKNLNKLISTSAPTNELNETSSHLMQLMTQEFRLEEQLMRTFNYPDIAEHTAEHQSINSQLTKLSPKGKKDQYHLLVQLIYFGIWLKHHETWADKQLENFLEQQDTNSVSGKLAQLK